MDGCLYAYTHKYVPNLLRGKVLLISGGGSGIGFRIAELFMRHGCDCAIASRSLPRLKAAAKLLSEATGRKCLPLQMDVRKYDQVEKGVKRVIKEFGKIDILINNAAGNFLCPVSAMSSNAFRTVIEIDTIGTFNLSKAVYTHCFSQPDKKGVILNISATLHYQGTPLQAHVGSAKAAIDALSKHLAVEWGKDGVRVNVVAPGPIGETEGMRKLRGDYKDRDIESMSPLQRIGSKTEVAEACIFLCSPLSENITGAILTVDGGGRLTQGGQIQKALSALKSRL